MPTKQHIGVQSLLLLTIVRDVLDVLGHCWKHLIMFENTYKSFDRLSLFKDNRSLFKTHGQSGFFREKVISVRHCSCLVFTSFVSRPRRLLA